MKKALYILSIVVVMVSCENYFYDDYINDFDYTAVYFPNQDLERSFVYGEFNHIQVAVQLGGKRENTEEEWVNFEIDESMAVDDHLTLLPESYYTLSDAEQFVILPGDLGGEISLSVTEEFFQRADTTSYYLPFRLLSSSLDTILESKASMVLLLNMETRGFGHYYHNGVMQIDSIGGSSTTIAYHQEEPVTNEINNWELTSHAKDTLLSNGIGDRKASVTDYSFLLSIHSDNTVGITASQASEWKVMENGVSVYNPEKHEFYLNYAFNDADGNNYAVSDTLIFRNRVLDGVNQWKL